MRTEQEIKDSLNEIKQLIKPIKPDISRVPLFQYLMVRMHVLQWVLDEDLK